MPSRARESRTNPVSLFDPLLTVMADLFKAAKIANFPVNEHWRRSNIRESIPCDTMMPVH
jgi:hypothetical protein